MIYICDLFEEALKINVTTPVSVLNYLSYIQKRYKLNRSAMADFLGVSRPTLYKYMDYDNTNEIPEKLLKKFAEVHSFETFEELIALEEKICIAKMTDLPKLEQAFIYNRDKEPDLNKLEQYLSVYRLTYDIEKEKAGPYTLKDEFDLRRKYRQTLRRTSPTNNYSVNTMYSSFENTYNDMKRSIPSNLPIANSRAYNEILSSLLNNEALIEDYGLLQVIKDYISNKKV